MSEEAIALLARVERGEVCSSSGSGSGSRSAQGSQPGTEEPTRRRRSSIIAVFAFAAGLVGLLVLASTIDSNGQTSYRTMQSLIASSSSVPAGVITSDSSSSFDSPNGVNKGADDWLELGIDDKVLSIGENEDEEEDSEDDEDEDDEDEDDEATTTTTTSSTTTTTSSSSRTFSLKREGYELLDFFVKTPSSSLTYAFFADHTALVEPYTETDLVVFDDTAESGFDEVSNFRFRACKVGTEETCQDGVLSPSQPTLSSTITFECSPFDTYDITVSKFNAEWEQEGEEMSGTAICMYVRREIRDLTVADLDKTMDAMYALWSSSQEDGEATYGKMFKNSTYFASAHDFNAAWQDADHIHEGLGFIPQHIKITNIFEVSMQSVDRSVTLPYWDFTLDYAKNLTIFESPMFTSLTFGTLTPPADHYWGWTYKNDKIEDAVISDGRWKSAVADLNYAFPDLQNGFGYIRGPWNMNPSPNIVRFASYTLDLPSCLDYFAWGSDSDFLDFLAIAAYGPHASTHGVIGAVFGCDLMDPLLAGGIINSEESQLSICKKWGFYLKELYRSNYIVPRTNCSATSLAKDDIDCGFTCNAASYDDMLTELPSVISSAYVPANMDESGWKQWRDFICEGDASLVFVGDHLESASPSDPSFWPIHPTQERLLQAKYMSGGWQDLSWPSDAVKDYVCDKSECYESDIGAKDYYADCCYGHYENDQLLDFENGDKTAGIGPTNRQTMDDTNAASTAYAMPYVYQHFKWDHCEEDFESMLTGGGGGGGGSANGLSLASGAANDPSVSTTTLSSSISSRASAKAKSSKKSSKKSRKKSSKSKKSGKKSSKKAEK